MLPMVLASSVAVGEDETVFMLDTDTELDRLTTIVEQLEQLTELNETTAETAETLSELAVSIDTLTLQITECYKLLAYILLLFIISGIYKFFSGLINSA